MSFRSALLASAAILTAGTAFAADLPARVAAPAPYIAAPIFTWTGFYVGLNAGAAWNDNGHSVTGTVNPVVNPVFVGRNGDDAGFTGGAQIGYNMQFGSFVAGVEADINYLDRGNGGSGVFPAVIAGTTGTDFRVRHGSGDNWFGTVRARLGFAFDRALIYGTGGLAFGGKAGSSGVDQRDWGFTDQFNPVPSSFTVIESLRGTGDDDDNIGWALGGGFEYAFSNAWSVKLEYLHVDLGNNSRTFRTLAAPAGGSGYQGGQTITVRNENKFDIVRAGVNFRF